MKRWFTATCTLRFVSVFLLLGVVAGFNAYTIGFGAMISTFR